MVRDRQREARLKCVTSQWIWLFRRMIYISRTLLPSIQEYRKYLKRIWKANWLTNNGQLVQELEEKLKEYWGVKNVVCVSSGTSAITVAMKAMELEEIHMSPNSFVATASAPDFINVKPIFYDVDEEPKGTALVTHLYGMPSVIDHKPVKATNVNVSCG